MAANMIYRYIQMISDVPVDAEMLLWNKKQNSQGTGIILLNTNNVLLFMYT